LKQPWAVALTIFTVCLIMADSISCNTFLSIQKQP
jgi:hypothetical protein